MSLIRLVEGNANVRAATQGRLEANGYSVVAVSDGAEALHYPRQAAEPCLIPLDLLIAGRPVLKRNAVSSVSAM